MASANMRLCSIQAPGLLMKTIAVLAMAILAATSCSTIEPYREAGQVDSKSAELRFLLPANSVLYLYHDGENCKGLTTLPGGYREYFGGRTPLRIPAGKTFSANVVAQNASTASYASCSAIVSFLPEEGKRYRLYITDAVSADSCRIGVVDESNNELSPTFRVRERISSFTNAGPFCK